MHHFLIRRPIAVCMCVIALVVLGVVAALRIPVSLMPDIDVPQITVRISRPGSSAGEIEASYTSFLQGQLMHVDGVASVRSESRSDIGTVILSFEPGSDMDILFIEVNEKIDRAMNFLPKDSERPRVIKGGAMDIPAFYLDIYSAGTDKSEARFAELGRFVGAVVSKRVEQLPQTAMVDMSGTAGTEIIVTPDISRLTALGLSEHDIENAIRSNNITLSTLSIADGIYRYHIHFDSQILTKEDIGNICFRHQGRILRIGDICDVEERLEEPAGIVRHDGHRAVTMAVIKQPDARMEDLQESMGLLLDDMRKEFPDISFTLTRDQTELLSSTMNNLKGNLIVGALLACLVLLLFMRQWRLSLLVVISIPLSLVLTLLGFAALGISVNIISLSGLILGTGMIVDNAIIVIDNILRRRQDGEALENAVVYGTREVFTPMLSSVLTTCSVFIPLVFLSGTAGALFFDQAIGMTMSLVASLVVAAVVIPVFLFAMYRRRDNATERRHRRIDRVGSHAVKIYEKILGHMLRHAGKYFAAALCMLPATAVLFAVIEKDRMPALPHHDMIVRIDWNSGISATENDRRVQSLLSALGDLVVSSTSMAGVQDFMLPHTPDITQNEAVIYIDAGSSDKVQQIQTALPETLKEICPGAAMEISEAGNVFSLLFSTDEPDLEIQLQSKDGHRPSLADTRAFSDSIRARFPGLVIAPVETETDIRLVADMERMAFYQVGYDALLARLRALVNQGKVMEINDGAKAIPVIIGSPQSEAEGLLERTVTNSEGTPVPLRLLVDRRSVEDYKQLDAAAGGEFYALEINAPDNVVRKVMEYSENLVGQPGARWSVSFGGSYFSSRKLIGELSLVLCVALALLFFILAAQFESLVQPLIILLEMAVDVFFIVLMLWISGMTLNIMSMIGLVVVAGIVINDSILKVDTINRLRRGGASVTAAIVRAGHWRLRPIIMTSLTTILALVPFLWQNDMASALQQPLSITLIVGLGVGMLVSLFFIPLLYAAIYNPHKRKIRAS